MRHWLSNAAKVTFVIRLPNKGKITLVWSFGHADEKSFLALIRGGCGLFSGICQCLDCGRIRRNHSIDGTLWGIGIKAHLNHFQSTKLLATASPRQRVCVNPSSSRIGPTTAFQENGDIGTNFELGINQNTSSALESREYLIEIFSTL